MLCNPSELFPLLRYRMLCLSGAGFSSFLVVVFGHYWLKTGIHGISIKWSIKFSRNICKASPSPFKSVNNSLGKIKLPSGFWLLLVRVRVRVRVRHMLLSFCRFLLRNSLSLWSARMLMISAKTGQTAHTKQFWREHQEHIYLMCLSSSLVPNPEELSPSALMHLGAEWRLF